MAGADFAPLDCAAILGVGLMGGSLGMALRARGLARRVVGFDRSGEVLQQARERGAIDAGESELAEAVRDADCIFAAAPVSRIPGLLERIAPHARPDALITDLGSVKRAIVEMGERLFGPRFVGGHPMAGSEAGGIGAARADLFTGAAWAVVRSGPVPPETDAPASRLAALIAALDARPVFLDAQTHDRLVALVSHLPHALSFAFAQAVAAAPDADIARMLAGGSYRDILRVSQADPFLWRDILHANRDELLAALAAFDVRLAALKSALASDSPDALLACLQHSKPGP